ncbi:uncharacterized protein [Physcomitrium patens]|uniref:uncharacterized protein n=1 Tax=Physcomitrium patens TaxID=3218 RepID=UPI003CCD9BA2
MPASKSRGRRKLGHTLRPLNLILDSSQLKFIQGLRIEVLDTAPTTLCCVIGRTLTWDLVEFQKKISLTTTRCQESDEQRIWAATSFLTQIRGSSCHFLIPKLTPSLLTAFDLDFHLVVLSS